MIGTRRLRVATLGAALLVAAPLLSACGGGSHTTTGSTSSPTTGSSSAGNPSNGSPAAGGSGGGFPGASGSVAAISGASMEVQNQQSGQVTVSWTSSTAFTKTVKLTAADVTAGDCVTVTGSDSTGTLVANQVTLSKPTASGTCTSGRVGAGGGAFPGGNPPTGAIRSNNGSVPTPPSGSAPAGLSGFGFASGKVTSVGPSSMVIYGISSSGSGRSGRGSQTSTPATSVKSSNVTIGVNSSTGYTQTSSAAASSLAVGDCVTAVGSADSTGAVAARSIRIASTGGQTCSSGFGGFSNGGTANA